MNVALIHDYLTEFGGGERVLQALTEIFPEAPIYTLVYKKEFVKKFFPDKRIIASPLQKIPLAQKYHRAFLFLMPYAIEQFDLSRYDLVISNTASFSKGVITMPKTFHLCYCFTPTRYLWDDSQKYLKDFSLNSLFKILTPLFLNYLRIWDFEAAKRPDKFVAISQFIKKRIQKFYKQDAEVIYPPTEVKKFQNVTIRNEGYFLIVGRLIAYKHFEIAIEAFKNYNAKLKIIGKGPEEQQLKKLAGNHRNIEFLGWVDDKELIKQLSNCTAFIFPQEEDFGIAPIEAMACGKPVIAYRAGGALESILDKETGIFFEDQNPESLLQALQNFNASNFNPEKIKQHAQKFDKEIFKQNFCNLIANLHLN